MVTAVITKRAIVELGVRGALPGRTVQGARSLATLKRLCGCELVLVDLLSCSEAELDEAQCVSDEVPVVMLVEWNAPERLPHVGHLGRLTLASGMVAVQRFVTQVDAIFEDGYISASEMTPARRARLMASPRAEAPSLL